MKWYKKLLLYFCIIILIGVVISVPFIINESYKKGTGYITMWNATDMLMFYGSVLAFVGTTVLGAVSIMQTNSAHHISKIAHKQSSELFSIQKQEYTPIMIVNDFVGLTKFKRTSFSNSNKNEIVIGEFRTNDNEVAVGYMIHMDVENDDMSDNKYTRTYQVKFKYLGKYVISNILLKKIKFISNDFIREFVINKSLNISLYDSQEITLFCAVSSINKFEEINSIMNKIVTSRKIEFEIELKSISDVKHLETITIVKHLIKEPEKQFNTPNIEAMVSAQYDIQEIYN